MSDREYKEDSENSNIFDKSKISKSPTKFK